MAATHERNSGEGNLGDWHAAGQRNLFNRMIGQLYHCLKQGTTYDESLAFGVPPTEAIVSAA